MNGNIVECNVVQYNVVQCMHRLFMSDACHILAYLCFFYSWAEINVYSNVHSHLNMYYSPNQYTVKHLSLWSYCSNACYLHFSYIFVGGAVVKYTSMSDGTLASCKLVSSLAGAASFLMLLVVAHALAHFTQQC